MSSECRPAPVMPPRFFPESSLPALAHLQQHSDPHSHSLSSSRPSVRRSPQQRDEAKEEGRRARERRPRPDRDRVPDKRALRDATREDDQGEGGGGSGNGDGAAQAPPQEAVGETGRRARRRRRQCRRWRERRVGRQAAEGQAAVSCGLFAIKSCVVCWEDVWRWRRGCVAGFFFSFFECVADVCVCVCGWM